MLSKLEIGATFFGVTSAHFNLILQTSAASPLHFSPEFKFLKPPKTDSFLPTIAKFCSYRDHLSLYIIKHLEVTVVVKYSKKTNITEVMYPVN